MSLTTKLSDIGDARDKAGQEHEDLFKKVPTEAESSEEYFTAKRSDSLFRYYNVLRSTRGSFKVADECNACYIDTLTQLRLVFDENRNVKAGSSSSSLS